MEKEYTFNFTEQEATQILNTLAKEPYIQVSNLINKIQKQAVENQEVENKEKK